MTQQDRLLSRTQDDVPMPPVACPVRTTMNVLGGKWKLLILSYLIEQPHRYGELRRVIPEITEKMLIQELRELEADGIVSRTVHQQVPPRVDYGLTEQGERVRPLLSAILDWSNGYLATRRRPMA